MHLKEIIFNFGLVELLGYFFMDLVCYEIVDLCFLLLFFVRPDGVTRNDSTD